MLNGFTGGLKFNNKKNVVLSPIEGKIIPICEVSDPTFGKEILGKGVAIQPSKGRVVAPVNGTIALIFHTKHAIILTSEEGTEILIHIGLDTVNLKGEYFNAYVKTDDKVKAGDLLLEFDIDKITEAGYDLISPIVICNTFDYSNIKTITDKNVQELDKIMILKK